MKFNPQLKNELKRYEQEILHQKTISGHDKPTTVIAKNSSNGTNAATSKNQENCQRREKVVGGEILWKPIDRAAAMLLAKAPWWAQPVYEKSKTETKTPDPNQIRAKEDKTTHAQTRNKSVKQRPKRKRKHMRGANAESGGTILQQAVPTNGKYTSKSGLTITMVNGEPFFPVDEVDQLIAEQISKLPAETRPNVLAAQDARKIIRELMDGIGGEMDKFNANTKKYLEDIRQTRFAVVTETASMTKELKDVRQFFLGNDYNEQITRLREFVDLCERLHKLKQSGFLDSVADTMLRLAN